MVQEVPVKRIAEERMALATVRSWEGAESRAFRDGAVAVLQWLEHQGPAASTLLQQKLKGR